MPRDVRERPRARGGTCRTPESCQPGTRQGIWNQGQWAAAGGVPESHILSPVPSRACQPSTPQGSVAPSVPAPGRPWACRAVR